MPILVEDDLAMRVAGLDDLLALRAGRFFRVEPAVLQVRQDTHPEHGAQSAAATTTAIANTPAGAYGRRLASTRSSGPRAASISHLEQGDRWKLFRHVTRHWKNGAD
jgi:hypothetical protein